MAYFLYKYLRRKNQERKAARNGEVPVAEQSHITQAQTAHAQAVNVRQPEERPAGASKAAIMKTVLLMVGLALPVILETLDYTGAFVLSPPRTVVTHAHDMQLSQRPKHTLL